MLIRDPTPGILPGISDFALIKNSKGGFSLEDADGHAIKTPLTDITSAAEVADVNGDGSPDLILTGLDTHFPGSSDWIVYGNTSRGYTIPQAHINIPGLTARFFRELGGWVDNANYFENNLPRVPKVKSRSFPLDAEGEIYSRERLEEAQAGVNSNEGCLEGALCGLPGDPVCEGFNIDCDTFSGDGSDIRGLNLVLTRSSNRNIVYGQWAADPCASGMFVCDYGPESQVVSVRDAADDPAQPNETVVIRTVFDTEERVTVRDFTIFNPDAHALYRDYLPAIRSSGAVQPGSAAALAISRTLEAYLGTTVFDGGLASWGDDTLPGVEDDSSFSGVTGDMLNVMGYFRDAMPQRVGYREQITLDERKASGYWDLLAVMPACTFLEEAECTRTNLDFFGTREKRAIKNRLDGLIADLAGRTYESADAAARALHDSELHKLAYFLNIEVGAIIDDTVYPVRIENSVVTDFESRSVGNSARDLAEGKSVWHNHPSGSDIWWWDAVVYALNHLDAACSAGNNITAYASGASLSKASVRQVLNESIMTMNIPFDYQVDVGNAWITVSTPYDMDMVSGANVGGYKEHSARLICTD